ncbi:hypothetical protein V6N13_023544 [Hibiscus sabdariffa]|uniref:Uncharacterized protein n=1 Tax=Hibiscus sabdariffa TaxID=183260 RepID=A0ABR2PM59_9ROSI
MGSSVIINVPSPPSSSSSSSSSSSRVHQAADNEGEDRVGMGMGGKLSGRKRFSKKLGHGVPRLVRDGVENGRKLNSLSRGIEELDKGDNQLNLEIEQLERKVLMLMLAKELKGEELGKLGEDDEILKAMKLSDKLKDLGIGAEDRKKKSGKGKVPKPEIRRRKVNPNKKKVVQKIEKTGKKIHEAYVSDDDGDKDEKKLSKEIEILEAMIERGRYGLVDLQTMMEEVKAIKGSEKMENEIKERMNELESELQELENAIVALKRKKIKQLTGQIQKVEETEMKYEEHEDDDDEEEDDGDDDEEENKINWGSVIGSVGAIAVAAAAVFLMGRSSSSSKMEFKSEKNRRQNESR